MDVLQHTVKLYCITIDGNVYFTAGTYLRQYIFSSLYSSSYLYKGKVYGF